MIPPIGHSGKKSRENGFKKNIEKAKLSRLPGAQWGRKRPMRWLRE